MPHIRKLFTHCFTKQTCPQALKTHAFRKTQQGRSMVEILAVLSIIGVLSIASYAGIQLGLSKAQANKIAYSVNLQAHALIIKDKDTPLQSGIDLLPQDTKTENNYPMAAAIEENVDGTIRTLMITVSDVPKGICNQTKTMLPDGAFYITINTAEVSVNGTYAGTCTDNNNDLTYYFDPDNYNAGTVGTNSDNGSTGNIEQAKSDYLCAHMITPCGICTYCENGECLTEEDGTTCQDQDGTGVCLDTECVACLNDNHCAGQATCVNNECVCPEGSAFDNDGICVCTAAGKILYNGHCVCTDNACTNGQVCDADDTHECVDCINDSHCSGQATCVNHVCVCPDTSHFENGTCVCDSGKTLSNAHCCPNATPVWDNQTEKCICTETSCAANQTCNDGTCITCDEEETPSNGHCCPNTTPLWDTQTNTCICTTDPDSCPTGQFCDGVTCQPCPTAQLALADTTQAENCAAKCGSDNIAVVNYNNICMPCTFDRFRVVPQSWANTAEVKKAANIANNIANTCTRLGAPKFVGTTYDGNTGNQPTVLSCDADQSTSAAWNEEIAIQCAQNCSHPNSPSPRTAFYRSCYPGNTHDACSILPDFRVVPDSWNQAEAVRQATAIADEIANRCTNANVPKFVGTTYDGNTGNQPTVLSCDANVSTSAAWSEENALQCEQNCSQPNSASPRTAFYKSCYPGNTAQACTILPNFRVVPQSWANTAEVKKAANIANNIANRCTQAGVPKWVGTTYDGNTGNQPTVLNCDADQSTSAAWNAAIALQCEQNCSQPNSPSPRVANGTQCLIP